MKKITLVEVGPRDGFQNVKEYIPREIKMIIIDGLIEAGVRRLQLTSFVSPKAVPQMKDAHELVRATIAEHADQGLELFALVPNLYGAKAAADAGLREVSTVISVSERHNLANVKQTVAQSLQGLAAIRRELPELAVTLDLATTFSCPFAGETPIEDVLSLMKAGSELGIRRFSLCDTIGTATPGQVRDTVKAVRAEFPEVLLDIHIHDTRNMGTACTLAAVESGITNVQAALGGLGGCPFAPGASGNVATEDVVYMLERMGYETCIDFARLLAVSKYQKTVVQGNYSGHQVNIGEDCAG